MPRELRFSTGGVVVDLTVAGDGREFQVADAYEPFGTDDQPEVLLRVAGRVALDERVGERFFDSGGLWTLYRDQDRWTISVASPALDPHPYLMAIMQPDFASGDVHVRIDGACENPLPFPLRYPLGEVLMINLLSLGRGVLLHACGVVDQGRGLIFAGKSGAGKSTIANLWKDQEGVTILSDDRIIVREKDGLLWVYGTPWHGEASLCSPLAVPLDRVFIVAHGRQTRAVRLDAPRALASLLVRSFPTYWNPQGMRFILDFLGRMSHAVPCYDLDFLPDRGVIDFVRAMEVG